MVKVVSVIFIFLLPFATMGQAKFLEQIEIYKLNDPTLKEIQFCVFKKDIDKEETATSILGWLWA